MKSLIPGALFSLLVAFQFSFAALYLFTNKKGNKRNNRLLAFVFLMFSLNLLDFTARISGTIFTLPLLHLADDCFFLLYGPVLFFYTKGVVYRDFKFRKGDSWHLFPYLAATLFMLFALFTTNKAAQSVFANKMAAADFPAWVPLLNLFMYAHLCMYLFFSRRAIKTYRAVIREKFSNIDKINLDWLSFMLSTFFAIVIAAVINALVPLFGSTFMLYASALLLLLFSFYFINRVLFKALNQPALFSGITHEETEKYARSDLGPQQIEEYKSRLTAYVQANKPYLNPDLKLADLAQAMDTTPKITSQVINQGYQQTFFDFINTYRCEEVKRILKGPDTKITLLEAMYAAGFNSKSSFNKEFKKLTGETPTAFRKNLS